MAAAAGSAAAQTTTNINISSGYTKTGSGTPTYSATFWSSVFPSSTSGNAGSGLTFGDWSNGGLEYHYDTITYNVSVALTSNSVVNTLLVSDSTPFATNTVTFTNSSGATDTFTLVNHQTIRYVGNGGTLSGASSSGSTGGSVTAVNWDTGLGSSSGWRLDAQEFTLPTSWDGTTLTNIAFYESSSSYYTSLSGLQVITTPDPSGGGTGGTSGSGGSGGADTGTGSVPEPISMSLLAVGLLGLMLARRRAA
jgi:hypothetical protein